MEAPTLRYLLVLTQPYPLHNSTILKNYYMDRKGDPLNLTYKKLSQKDIPDYVRDRGLSGCKFSSSYQYTNEVISICTWNGKALED
jgi:hypothetical protein